MRRLLTGLVTVVAVLLPACSDQPTEVNPGSSPTAGEQAAAISCTGAGIRAKIDDLAPPGGLRNSLQSKFKSIPSKVNKQNGTAARDKMFTLVDFVLQSYYAGQFGSSPTVDTKVAELIGSLFCFIGLTPPTLPEESLGDDGVVGVVTPASPTTTLATPSSHAAVTIPAGAAPQPTLIVIYKLPDSPGPLLTSLDQYPFFYEFSSSPEVTFNLDVLAGICPRDNLDAIDANLRLAHNVGTDFGDVEVLPRPEGQVPGLDCTDLDEGEFSEFRRSSSRTGKGWQMLGRALTPVVNALLPEPLHAAGLVLATTGVGGTTKKFSPFGIVDVTSNPGSLGIVDEAGEPASGTVSGPGTVYVKTTSGNGAPIKDVPVDFDGTEVLTDDNGIAAFDWTDAEPGATLTPSVPNEQAEGEGEGCPSDIPAPGPTGGYRPFVCFTPDEVTFSVAVEGDLVVFNDYDMFRNDFVDQESVKLYQNLVDFPGTGTRGSGTSVLIHQGHGSRCLGEETGLICETTWATFAASMSEAGEGYTVTFVDDETAPLTAIDEDVKLLILVLPTENYTIAEINALKTFVGEGGRLVFVAEHGSFDTAILTVQNNLFADMGSAAVNNGGLVDCGLVFLPQSSLQAHQIMAGLTHLRIGCASVLSLGEDDEVLFYDTSGEDVLAAAVKVSLTPIDEGELVALRRPLRSLARPTTPTPGLRPSSTTGQ